MTFEAAELAMGPSVSKLVAYFETCRRKRNTLDYDVVSDTEAGELLQKIREFRQEVEAWIARHHPSFVP